MGDKFYIELKVNRIFNWRRNRESEYRLQLKILALAYLQYNQKLLLHFSPLLIDEGSYILYPTYRIYSSVILSFI